jgi:hypothetical protein
MGHYHLQCEEWCEDCLPVPVDSPEVDYDQGEQDTPANCCACGEPLDCSLTSEGVAYVLEAIRDSLREGREARNRLVPDDDRLSYYRGSRHCEIVRDWAKDLLNYGLIGQDRTLVAHYLSRTEK